MVGHRNPYSAMREMFSSSAATCGTAAATIVRRIKFVICFRCTTVGGRWRNTSLHFSRGNSTRPFCPPATLDSEDCSGTTLKVLTTDEENRKKEGADRFSSLFNQASRSVSRPQFRSFIRTWG